MNSFRVFALFKYCYAFYFLLLQLVSTVFCLLFKHSFSSFIVCAGCHWFFLASYSRCRWWLRLGTP